VELAVILRALAAAAIGFCQVFLIAFQTRQLAAGKRGLPIFLASIGISGIWVDVGTESAESEEDAGDPRSRSS
jgi:hypothetical protein